MHPDLARIVEKVEAREFRDAGALIEKSLAENPDELLSHRINMAIWLVLAADWPLVTDLLNPRSNFFSESGWLESLAQGKPVAGDGSPVPWYTYPAIDFLEPRIEGGFRVFEYGSGWSTLWWAERSSEVHAVEHDEAWHGVVQARLPRNAHVTLAKGADAYVREIDARGGEFDIVIVDGEHRNECARAAAARVKPGGAIVFDNSDRASFAEGIAHLSHSGWLRADFFGLTPCYPYKACTSVFFRDTRWLQCPTVPADQWTSIGPSCAQAMGE
jgi:hypothetical protein